MSRVCSNSVGVFLLLSLSPSWHLLFDLGNQVDAVACWLYWAVLPKSGGILELPGKLVRNSDSQGRNPERFFFKNLFTLFIYFWLRWVFVAVHGLSLVAVNGGYSSLRCAGFSLWWLLLLQSMGSRPQA